MMQTQVYITELGLRVEKLRAQREVLDRRHEGYLATHQEFKEIKIETKRRALRNLQVSTLQRVQKNERFWKELHHLRQNLAQAHLETPKARTLAKSQENLGKVANAMYPRWAEEVEKHRIAQIKMLEEQERNVVLRNEQVQKYAEKDRMLKNLLQTRMQSLVATHEASMHNTRIGPIDRQSEDSNTLESFNIAAEKRSPIPLAGGSSFSKSPSNKGGTIRPSRIHRKRPDNQDLAGSPIARSNATRQTGSETQGKLRLSYEWQRVPVGQVLPTGTEQKLDLANRGERLARIPPNWELAARVTFPDHAEEVCFVNVTRSSTVREVVEGVVGSLGVGPSTPAPQTATFGRRTLSCNSLTTMEDLGIDIFLSKTCTLELSSNENTYSPHSSHHSELTSPTQFHEREVKSPILTSSKAESIRVPPTVLLSRNRNRSMSPNQQDEIQKRLQERMLMEVKPLEHTLTSATKTEKDETSTRAEHSNSGLKSPSPFVEGVILFVLFDVLEEQERYKELRGSMYGTVGSKVSNEDIQKALIKLKEILPARDKLSEVEFETEVLCSVTKHILSELLPATLFSVDFLSTMSSTNPSPSQLLIEAEEWLDREDDVWKDESFTKRRIWGRIREHGQYLLREHVVSCEKLVGIMCEVLSPGLESSNKAAHRGLAKLLRVAFGQNVVVKTTNERQSSSAGTLAYENTLLGSEDDDQVQSPESSRLMSSIGLSSNPVRLSVPPEEVSSLLRRVGAVSEDEEELDSGVYDMSSNIEKGVPKKRANDGVQIRGSMIVLDSEDDDDF